MSKYFTLKERTLNDKLILLGIVKAYEEYKEGNVLEACEILEEITNSLRFVILSIAELSQTDDSFETPNKTARELDGKTYHVATSTTGTTKEASNDLLPTLRDLFAMACIDSAYHHARKTGTVNPERIAEETWDLVDAMMRERAKRGNE